MFEQTVGTKRILVGTCGFPSSRQKVFKIVDVVELQSTFYNLLSEKQIENIVRDKPSSVELTVKAWQVITHPATSPSWRKLKIKPEGRKENYGWLRPTKENIEALKKVVLQAERLNAKVLVFQTPGSMPVNDNVREDIEEFFDVALDVVGSAFVISWEPRGGWLHERWFLEHLERKGIIIITDVLRTHVSFIGNTIFYTRLHGLGGTRDVNYKYKYTGEDLERLADIVFEVLEKNINKAYILFNNVYMLQDAEAFKQVLEVRGYR